MTTKPIDIDRVEALLGVKLEPWQRVYLDRAFGDEARGMAGAYTLNQTADQSLRLIKFIRAQEADRVQARREVDADRAKQNARDTLAVGLMIGVMVGALVMGAILWAVM